MPGYEDDLAYIHDAGFRDLADASAPVILAALRERGIASGLVVDLGCGSGVTARRLIDAGYDVLGIDRSPEMIALARREAPRARFEIGSWVDAPLPRGAAAVTAIGEVFNYLFDARGGEEGALAAVLGRIQAALRPGGLLVFDLAGPGRVPGGGPVRGFREGEDWAILFEAVEDAAGGVLTRRMTTFRRERGARFRRAAEEHRLRLHEPGAALALLRAAGFRARALAAYGDGPRFPGLRMFLAERE